MFFLDILYFPHSFHQMNTTIVSGIVMTAKYHNLGSTTKVDFPLSPTLTEKKTILKRACMAVRFGTFERLRTNLRRQRFPEERTL